MDTGDSFDAASLDQDDYELPVYDHKGKSFIECEIEFGFQILISLHEHPLRFCTHALLQPEAG